MLKSSIDFYLWREYIVRTFHISYLIIFRLYNQQYNQHQDKNQLNLTLPK